MNKKTDFYASKSETLPRFVYRRLARTLGQADQSRDQAIEAAVTELLTNADSDLRKFKFHLPAFLRNSLSPEECRRIEDALSAKKRIADRLKLVYPHVADEFSLDGEFLATIFDLSTPVRLKRNGRFFTLGSCFARNIATHLLNNGYNASSFTLAEDLNSPISNAFMFDVAKRGPDTQREILAGWISRIFPEIGSAKIEKLASSQIALIGQMTHQIQRADCIVLTLGNVIDFFKTGEPSSGSLMEKIFPKFIAMHPSEDIDLRSQVAARLKAQGAAIRLASHDETRDAIQGCLEGIRALTAAPIVVTLSPVPIDSVMGLSSASLKSAIEVDCVSKSRLRSAFDDILQSQDSLPGIHYFPSFEIVRWVAPMLPIAPFGLDDAAARHVSSPILDAICALFLNKAISWIDT